MDGKTSQDAPEKVRPPAMAGRFYPADPSALRRVVEDCIASAAAAPAPAGTEVTAAIAPHAGYPYSGPTAGHVFARLGGSRFDRVILLGRSHHHAFEGAAILCEGALATPLGLVPVDEDFARALAERFGGGPEHAHDPEHALEVLLPFVQVCFGAIAAVPVLFGTDPAPWHAEFGRWLAGAEASRSLVIASTDLSHFLDESAANAIDRRTLARILSQDHEALAADDAAGVCSLCGATPVYAAMAHARARGARDWRLLDYRTSAAASGDRSRVVGYGAVTMERAA